MKSTFNFLGIFLFFSALDFFQATNSPHPLISVGLLVDLSWTQDLLNFNNFPLTKKLLHFYDATKYINSTNLIDMYDVIIWSKLQTIYSSNTKQSMRLFNNKLKWNRKMHALGLGRFVPHVYSEDNIVFPCILKLPR